MSILCQIRQFSQTFVHFGENVHRECVTQPRMGVLTRTMEPSNLPPSSLFLTKRHCYKQQWHPCHWRNTMLSLFQTEKNFSGSAFKLNRKLLCFLFGCNSLVIRLMGGSKVNGQRQIGHNLAGESTSHQLRLNLTFPKTCSSTRHSQPKPLTRYSKPQNVPTRHFQPKTSGQPFELGEVGSSK